MLGTCQESGAKLLKKCVELTPSEAEVLMPRDIMSSEPRHWMVFSQLAKYHPVLWLRWHNVSWHQVFRLPEGWATICLEIRRSDIFDTSSTSGYVGETLFQEFGLRLCFINNKCKFLNQMFFNNWVPFQANFVAGCSTWWTCTGQKPDFI